MLDANIAHAIGLERYSLHVQRKIIALLNRVDADLVDQIRKKDAALKTGYSVDRLKAMLDAVRTINANAYRAIKTELTGEVRALGVYAAEFQVRAITTVAPVVTNMVVPSSATLYAAAMARPFQGALLAVSYAGWISPSFQLSVNQTFLDYRSNKTKESNLNALAPSAEMREVRQIFHEGKRMATIAGFKGNQAVLSGQKLAIRLTGVDPLEIIGATHLVAPKQESLITPTDIGNRVGGYSSRAVNKLLESHGFQKQVRDLNGKSHWEMTDKGEKAGGVYLDTEKKHGDGTAVRQLKWGAGVVSELQG